MKKIIKKLLLTIHSFNPTAVIMMSFLLFVLIGSILLSLPVATEAHIATPYVDALFTATSATCITGLIVVDTASYWSTFGEVVILFLIQIGGLGFITLATFFLSISGRKTGLKSMMLTMESLNVPDLQQAIPLMRQIFIMVFCVELSGAMILSIQFVPEFGWKGFYYGIFHAISAFCNAGFDVIGEGFRSLSDYNGNPLVIYTISLLAIIGWLGFIVWKDLLDYKNRKKLLVHTRIVLVLTSVLFIAGALFIYVIESNGAFTGLSVGEKINAAFFLSVNSRSSGFSSFSPDNLRAISKAFIVLLMFIGGASGSTAGGIKINTLGIMLIAILCVTRSREETVFLKKRIPRQLVLKAFSITLLAGILVVALTFLLNLIQPEMSLMDALFESVSGLATVGLTTGITPDLATGNKLLLIFSMFAGRVGPLSFGLAFMMKRDNRNTVYPDGKFIVG
jgi:trk system potassium uptake protein TrkH